MWRRTRTKKTSFVWMVLSSVFPLSSLLLLLRSIRFSLMTTIAPSIYHDESITGPSSLNTTTVIDERYTNTSTVSSRSSSLSSTRRTRVIVSMTTIPERIEYIEPTLNSLLYNQTVPIYQLLLILPQESWIFPNKTIEYQEPEFLFRYSDDARQFNIVRPRHDYGPVGKLLHAVEYLKDNDVDILRGEHHHDDNDCKLIYLDDDVIYHETMVETLLYHHNHHDASSVLAFSGAQLRSNFRRIAHGRPSSKHNQHPNLYFWLSGDTFTSNDETFMMKVDIVQGFTGVMVPFSIIKTIFYNNNDFLAFVQETIRNSSDIWKADDWIISSWLEYHNISRFVLSGMPPSSLRLNPHMTRNLARTMHVQSMEAAYYLQQQLGIWQPPYYTFVDYQKLNHTIRALMDCESNVRMCSSNNEGTLMMLNDRTMMKHNTNGTILMSRGQEFQKRATAILDQELLV